MNVKVYHLVQEVLVVLWIEEIVTGYSFEFFQLRSNDWVSQTYLANRQLADLDLLQTD